MFQNMFPSNHYHVFHCQQMTHFYWWGVGWGGDPFAGYGMSLAYCVEVFLYPQVKQSVAEICVIFEVLRQTQAVMSEWANQLEKEWKKQKELKHQLMDMGQKIEELR